MNDIKWGKFYKISKQELDNVVKKSMSLTQVLQGLQINYSSGSNFDKLKKLLDFYQVDYKHISIGIHHAKGKSNLANIKRTPLNEILIENSKFKNSTSLKKRLLREGILKNICDVCGLSDEWNGQKLVLQMDHINGKHSDNRLENLRIICPNCHTQTKTYAGRKFYLEEIRKCKNCKKPRHRNSKSGLCFECYNEQK
jgi:hypothetical protein